MLVEPGWERERPGQGEQVEMLVAAATPLKVSVGQGEQVEMSVAVTTPL